MLKISIRVVVIICFLFFSSIFFVVPSFANNSPDVGHSSLNASNQAPADGQSTINDTVTLQDSSGNPLSGDTVSFSAPSDSAAVFNPTSAILDSNGQATFTVASTNAGTDNITVTDTSSSTTLDNLGQVTFTPVASPTPTSTPTPTPSACSDAAPGGTPQLTSAVPIGTNQITLTWTDAPDPVTNYLIAYGLASGQYEYGNPNVGGQGTTSYTVGSLASGMTYYFVVEAVNGCNPGSYSNEVSATAGKIAAETPTPTVSVVMGSETNSQNSIIPSVTPVPSQTITPSPVPTQTAGDSKTKTLEYIIACILIFGGVAIFVSWRNNRYRKSGFTGL